MQVPRFSPRFSLIEMAPRSRKKRRKQERRARRKRLHCKKTTQMVAAGRQQVQWVGVYPGHPALSYPCPVCHHR